MMRQRTRCWVSAMASCPGPLARRASRSAWVCWIVSSPCSSRVMMSRGCCGGGVVRLRVVRLGADVSLIPVRLTLRRGGRGGIASSFHALFFFGGEGGRGGCLFLYDDNGNDRQIHRHTRKYQRIATILSQKRRCCCCCYCCCCCCCLLSPNNNSNRKTVLSLPPSPTQRHLASFTRPVQTSIGQGESRDRSEHLQGQCIGVLFSWFWLVG